MNFNKLILLPLLVVLTTNAFGQGYDAPADDQAITINKPIEYYKPYTPFSADLNNIVGSGVLLTADPNEFPLDYSAWDSIYNNQRGTHGRWSPWDPIMATAHKQLAVETQCKVNNDGLVKTLEQVNIGTCWENRNLAGQNDKALIEMDRVACKCVSDRTSSKDLIGLRNSDAASTLTSSGNKSPAELKLEIFDNKSEEIRRRMDHNTWALSFQASVISDGRPDFTAQYTINTGDTKRPPRTEESTLAGIATGGSVVAAGSSKSTGVTGGGLAEIVGVIRNRDGGLNARDITGHRAGVFNGKAAVEENKDADERINSSMSKLLTASVPDTTLLSGEEKFKPGQCVGAREFFAFKQIPDGERVLKEFSDPSKFKPEFWNPRTLRKRYNELMANNYDIKKNNREEILLLKEKLQFLERNPLLKNFLGAETSELDGYIKLRKIPKERADVIRTAYYGQPLLEDRKQALLDIMKKAIPPADCKTQECIVDYTKKHSAETIKAEMAAFFGNKMNADVTTVETDRANIGLTKSFIADKENLFTTKPSDFTYPKIVENFVSQYGVGSPSDCVASNIDYQNIGIERCAKIFVSYCRDLEKKKNDIDTYTSNDRALMDDLDSNVATFFETDMDKNPEFKKFNDEVCNTKRRESTGKQDPTKYMTFWDYKKQFCTNPSDCDTTEKITKLRMAYLKQYRVAYNQNEAQAQKVLAFNRFIESDPVKNVPKDKLETVVAGRSVNSDVNLDNFNRDSGFKDNLFDDDSTSKFASKSVADSSYASTSKDTPKSETRSIDPVEEMANIGGGVNYAAGTGTSNIAANNDQAPKVENMTDPQRQELMDDWQKEYDTWKKNKTANDGSPAASATESAMQARIQALEQLLAQQKKLTEDQYKLLNDAIANQNKANTAAVASNDGNNSSSSSNGRNRSTTAVSSSNDDDDSVGRGPASIGNQPQSTSGSKSGAASAGVGGGATATRRVSVGGSTDDVAREEAKLVNMRSNSDGSIVISSVNTGSGASANAISVPVSDDQYRALQANPQSLNLSQIEKNIPKDQIAKLEKDGEIVILLRNGSNPPFEVKVEKKNNKLVYSLKDKNGKDQAPVRRVFTRQALELQLKANR